MLVFLGGVVVVGRRGLLLVVGFLVFVGFRIVGFVIGLVSASARLLAESFPMSGVDGMSESFHVVESLWLALLAHDVFDAFRRDQNSIGVGGHRRPSRFGWRAC